jgi:hypothetical protein
MCITATYNDFGEVSSKEEKILPPHWLINHTIDLERGYKLPYGRITIDRSCVEQSFQLSQVQSGGFHTIVWNMITSSRSRIVDLNLKIPCQMDGSMSGYCLIVSNMSQD